MTGHPHHDYCLQCTNTTLQLQAFLTHKTHDDRLQQRNFPESSKEFQKVYIHFSMFFLFLTPLCSCDSLCLADSPEYCPPGSKPYSNVQELIQAMNNTETCHVALRKTSFAVAILYLPTACPEVFFNCTSETSFTLAFGEMLPRILEISEGSVKFQFDGNSVFPNLNLSNVRSLNITDETMLVENLTTDFKSISTLKQIKSDTVYFTRGNLSSNVSVAPLREDALNIYFGGFERPMTVEIEAPRRGRLTLTDNRTNVAMKIEPVVREHSVTIEVCDDISVLQSQQLAREYIPMLNFTMRGGKVYFDGPAVYLSDPSVAIICYFGLNAKGHIFMSTTVEMLSIHVAATAKCSLNVAGQTLNLNSIIFQGQISIDRVKDEDITLHVNYVEVMDFGYLEISYSRITLEVDMTNVTHGIFSCLGSGCLSLVKEVELDLAGLTANKLIVSPTLSTTISCMVTKGTLSYSNISVIQALNCPGLKLHINVKYCGTTIPSDADIRKVMNDKPIILALPDVRINATFMLDSSNVVPGFREDASVVEFPTSVGAQQIWYYLAIMDYPSRIYRQTCFYVRNADLCDEYPDHVAFSAEDQSLSNWTTMITDRTQTLNIVITESTNTVFSFVHPYKNPISVFLTGNDEDLKIRIDMRNRSFVRSLSVSNLNCTFEGDLVNVESLSLQENASITGLWLQRCEVEFFEVHYSLFRPVYDMFAGDSSKSITLNMGHDLQLLTFYHDENGLTLCFGDTLQVPMYNVSASFYLASYAAHLNLSSTMGLRDDRVISLNLYCRNVTINFDASWDTSNDSLLLAGVGRVNINTVSNKLPLQINNIGQIDIALEQNLQLDLETVATNGSTTMQVSGPDPDATYRIGTLLFNTPNRSTAFVILEEDGHTLHAMVDTVAVVGWADATIANFKVTEDVVLYPYSHLTVRDTNLSSSVITLECDISRDLPRIDVDSVIESPKEIFLKFGDDTSSTKEFHTTNVVCGLLQTHCEQWLTIMHNDTATVTINGNDYDLQKQCYTGNESSCLQVVLNPASNWKFTRAETAVITSGIIGVTSMVISSVFIFRMVRGYDKNRRERQEEFGIV